MLRAHKILLFIAHLGVLMFASAALTAAPQYPDKPMRVIIPMAPGGAIDILARPLAQQMTRILGASVVIDNRGGAGGNIGGDMVAKASPDGYTLLLTTSGLIVANKSLYKQMPFDPQSDLVPVSIVASLPNVLVVNPKSPYHSVQDIVDAAAKEPGKLNFASGGTGSSNHLAGELFKSLSGINLVHVPYRGGGPAVVAVMAGDVTMLFATLPSVTSQIEGGRLRALAVTSSTRAPQLPQVPTMMQAGVKGFETSVWIGALAPHGTPAGVVDKLQKAIVQALATPELKSHLQSDGYQAVGSTPAQMAATIKNESAKWAQVIKEAGIQPD
jgi:tripartite-type tricarboxylate transporter receptor subunit TctC